MDEFDPAVEASKDTIYLRLKHDSDKLLAEYYDILHYANTVWIYSTGVDMQYLADLVNDAWRISVKASNAASYRFYSVYTSLGGQ
jgi:hypothetical protein